MKISKENVDGDKCGIKLQLKENTFGHFVICAYKYISTSVLPVIIYVVGRCLNAHLLLYAMSK